MSVYMHHVKRRRIMAATIYTQPGQVSSPKRHWKLLTVLEAGSEGTGSVALGRWDDQPVLAMRWNGNADNPIGNPQSRGLATWFIIPDNYMEPLLATFSPDKQALAKTFLGR
jgi:hypothetical protein